jgi:hypothetical protein
MKRRHSQSLYKDIPVCSKCAEVTAREEPCLNIDFFSVILRHQITYAHAYTHPTGHWLIIWTVPCYSWYFEIYRLHIVRRRLASDILFRLSEVELINDSQLESGSYVRLSSIGSHSLPDE